jgi:hypothetical protein
MTIKPPNYGTIKQACEMIGGKGKPVHASTYYRGAAQGLYPKPVHPSPNIARVDLDALAAGLPRAGGDAGPSQEG